jgi:hypothetical protein
MQPHFAESGAYSVIASGFVPLHADYRNGATLDAPKDATV